MLAREPLCVEAQVTTAIAILPLLGLILKGEPICYALSFCCLGSGDTWDNFRNRYWGCQNCPPTMKHSPLDVGVGERKTPLSHRSLFITDMLVQHLNLISKTSSVLDSKEKNSRWAEGVTHLPSLCEALGSVLGMIEKIVLGDIKI